MLHNVGNVVFLIVWQGGSNAVNHCNWHKFDYRFPFHNPHQSLIYLWVFFISYLCIHLTTPFKFKCVPHSHCRLTTIEHHFSVPFSVPKPSILASFSSLRKRKKSLQHKSNHAIDLGCFSWQGKWGSWWCQQEKMWRWRCLATGSNSTPLWSRRPRMVKSRILPASPRFYFCRNKKMFNFVYECFQISKLFRGCCGTLLLSRSVHAECQSLDPSSTCSTAAENP